ncbi:MAG TPA: GDSL-type esterase/lipase family protein [Polyangiaceae bacterium]|nr:GDSL-type esterase/lipase family protein [Polyangiaceae bacterium]
MRAQRGLFALWWAGVGALAILLAAPQARAAPLRVTCTGSSSMAGTGSSAGHHVTDELANALGADFVVSNFAVAATTAIKSVPNAWASTTQFTDALASNPDIVLFWFGGNDSWVDVWTTHSAEFKPDYKSIVQQFQALPSHPKIFLIRLWVFKDGPAQLSVLDQEILPQIDQIGTETNSTVIDYKTFILPHPEWFDDGMHANDTGTVFIGQFFADQINAVLNASADAGVIAMGGAAGASAGGGSPSGAEGPTAGAAGSGGAPTMNAGGSSPGTGGSGGTTSAAAGTPGSGTVGAAGAASGATAGGGGSSVSPMPTGGTTTTTTNTASPDVGSKGSGCTIRRTSSSGAAVLLLSALFVLARRRRGIH